MSDKLGQFSGLKRNNSNLNNIMYFIFLLRFIYFISCISIIEGKTRNQITALLLE